MLAGSVEHGDSLGNRGVIGAGDVQWMTAGSGIIHQEMPRGDELTVQAGDDGIRFLLISGKPLQEPVAWYGPIVMNTQAEPRQAFEELQEGTFLKPKAPRGRRLRAGCGGSACRRHIQMI